MCFKPNMNTRLNQTVLNEQDMQRVWKDGKCIQNFSQKTSKEDSTWQILVYVRRCYWVNPKYEGVRLCVGFIWLRIRSSY
jgi:hypothetical protein